MDPSAWFAGMTVSQFKAFKKGHRALVNAGVSYDRATELLLFAAVEKNKRRGDYHDSDYPSVVAR